MKTKEELLKVYSAYLPYELKFISCDAPMIKNAWVMVGVKLNERFSDTILSKREDYKNTINISTNTAKPILYSMDMLTKEIEHKGERFIPMDELTNGKTVSGNLNDYAEDWNERTYHPFEDYVDEWINGESGYHLDFLPYGFIQKLTEWHFNVFGLDESEYIKKESVIQK